MTINQFKVVDIIYKIKGFEKYGFGKDKNLYNLKTGRLVKLCLKGYTRGYNLNGKFISQKIIKPLLIKIIKCPF